MLVGLGIAALTAILALVLPHRVRLIGVALLFVPQIWITGLPSVELATVAVVWTVVTCLAGLTAQGRSRANSPLLVIMGVLVAVTAVSLAWALPSGMGNGVSAVVRGVLFMIWLHQVIVVARAEPGLLDTLAMWCVPGIAAQAVLSIVFRVSPTTEEIFLKSSLATYFVGHQAEHLYTDWRNNVLYPFKSGGLYVNGNVASLFGAIGGLLLIVVARRTGRKWLYVFAALSITGAIYTGSKTALVLAPICLIAIIFLPHMLKGSAALAALCTALLMPVIFLTGPEVLQRYIPAFYAATTDSAAGRKVLWGSAAQLLSESPLLGLGYGGWAEQMPRFTNRPELPPHNLLLATWVNSGLFAALAALVFMIAAITMGVRVAAAQTNVHDSRTAVIALCAVAWVFLHGIADNTTVYGEQRSMVLVALIFGYLYVMKENPQNRVVACDNGGNLAQHGLAPAIPRHA